MKNKLPRSLPAFCLSILLSSFLYQNAVAQNQCVPIITTQPNVTIPCGSTCTSLSITVPDIRQTTAYTVQTIPFAPYAYNSGTVITQLATDDIYSPIINLPFTVCFYGTTYTQAVVGANGVVTFDITKANCDNPWTLDNLPHATIPSALSANCAANVLDEEFPRAAIFGAMYDIDPSVTTSGGAGSRIEYMVTGSAPCRKLVISYYHVALFLCTTQYCTQQIVISEGTGDIEVYIANKPACAGWNSGYAVLGIQNYARNLATAAPGKNNSVWTSVNEGYRFLPSGGTSRFVKSELYNGATLVATAVPTYVANTVVCNFANVCPAVTTNYTIRTEFQNCSDPANPLTRFDAVTVTKALAPTALTVTPTNATCGNNNGTVTIGAVTGGTAAYTYSFNGSAYTATTLYTNLAAGTYPVSVKDANNCVFSTTVTVGSTSGAVAPTVTSPVNYCQNAVASQLTATGTNLLWYTLPAGGIGLVTAPTPSTTTVGSTTYYVSQTPAGCESPRAAITVNVAAVPAAPTVTSPVTYCQGVTAVPLTATGTNLLWYTTAAGGVGSATAPTPSTVATGSTIYYVSQTPTTCEGPRAAITVTVNATPAAPTVTSPVTYCQGVTAVPLTATGTNLLWYANAVGGVGSATAPTPSTTTVGSTIYYVSQTTGTCEGPRAAITVTINSTPAAPTVTSPVTYCQGVTAVPLTATGTNLLWYANAVGGVGSATAPTPSTATVGSTIYYVSQTTGTCEGPRAAITVTINSTPAAPTVTSPVTYCQGVTAVPLTATGTNLLWYANAVGGVGSATAPTPSTATVGSTIYYVSQTTGTCEGPRAAITVTINSTPAAPTVTSPVTYCQGVTAVPLTATGTNLLWYANAVGGVGSATAPTPSTATIGSTIYYVSQTTGTCEGPRAAITVTINSTPAAPTVTSPVTYCQGVTAVPLTATGTNLLWYANAVGGVGSATAPTPSTVATGSTIYYVSQTTGTCEGPRAAITVTVNAMPAAPTVTSPVTYCQGATASALTATGTNLLWYANAVGGVGSATAPTPSTVATGSTIYYVSQTTGTCEGPRAAITVTINATPAAPAVTSPVTYCQGVTAVPLTATGTNLLWYANAVGGVGSATAPTPSTATAGSTIYYVSQTTGTCEGPRAAITVTIDPTPAAPAVTSPVTYCQSATAIPLTATGTNLLWYANAVGGVGSATAPTPSTATVGSTIYYVSQTTGTCEGPRAAITVTINATPAAPTVTSPVTYCQGVTAVPLTATGTNLLWYANAVGGVGSATAPIPSTATVGSTIYYVSQTTGTCEGPRAAITVTIDPTPAAPAVTSPVTYCQGVTAVPLTATGTNLLWYANAVGGVGSATAPTPSTATAGSTIYYVSQTTGTCEGPRAAITVTINATPAAPAVTSPVIYCQGVTSVPLTATGTNLLWYTNAVGGVGSATAPTPSTATIGSTIYYVSQTTGTCEGPRAAITVTINATPAAPTVTSPVTYCQGATAIPLTATGTNLLWYTNAVGGVGSATAPTPSTATVGSTIYYVSQTTATCEGPRAAITVTINATPGAPAVTSPVTYCQGVTAVPLTATGTNLLWYANAVGGVGSATAPTPSTATVGSTIYYVSQTTGTCEGPRAAITVTINATPAAPAVTSPVTYCQGATAVPLTATGTNLLWYTTAAGGVGSATTPTPSTATAGSTIYYVSQTTGTCEGPRAAITVTINATPAAPAVTSPVTYCQGATAVSLTATGTNLLWYTTAAGGVGSATAPTPSTATIGSTIYYVSQTTGTCEGPRAAITVTINATPAAPAVTSPVTYCQGATAVPLTATGTNLLWYTTAAGGVGSATAPTPSTATAGSTIYYVSQTTGTCEGPRAAITVTINATPAAPAVTSPVTYCQGATAVPLTATGTNLLWYTTAAGGVGSATAPTPSTATVGSTIYYVSQTTGTCEGPRAAITVTVNTTPVAPGVTSPVIYCQGVTAVPLTATGTNLLWYTTAAGGVGSASAPTPSTVTVGSTTWYVSQSAPCEGPRAAITVTIDPTPAAPTVTSPVTYCQGVTAVPLTATGTNLLWYTTAAGGVGSATAPTPSTATIGSTIYYVSQTTGTCEGPRAAITVTIDPTPAAPAVTSPVTYCQGATAVPLTATGTNLLWYTAAAGGVGSATAPTPSTAAAGSTIYYVSQTTGTCEGPRAAITVTINATPAAPTVTSPVTYCQGATAVPLTATGTNLLWYTTAAGGVGSASAPTPSTVTVGSTTWYVSQSAPCEGPRAAITVTIDPTPAAPTVTSLVTYCQGVTAVPLTATGTNLLWYTTAAGGVGSATAPTPSTATIGSTIYYVSQTTGTCEGPRAAITVTINATPAAPAVTSPVTYCQGVTAVPLTATGTNLLWYTAAAGGAGSATAPTPSTATVGSTTWYVSQSAPCEGPRAAITVTINATPAAPTVTSPVTYCQGATAVPLTATGTNLLWYTTATGGVGSATAPTPSTAAAGSTIYYVSQTTGTCEGPRAALTVTIDPTPAAPAVTSPVTYCQGATAVPLTATGTNLLWYAAATGGVGSATAPTPSTATIGSTIYYVSQTTGTCEGPRAAITVTINATPAAPAVTSPITYCQGATAVPLTATGTNLLWYTTAAGGVGSATAPTPSTATVGSTTWYVSQSAPCEGPRAAITVTINATPAAPTVTSPVTYCQGATAVPLTATGTNLLWYAAATGGVGSATAPTPSTATAGSTIYYVSQTTGTCEGPRAGITVTINATPAAPTVTSPVTYCQGATAVPLTATGTNLLWYATAAGGVGSATAPTPSTATAGSTIYYVSQTTGTCEGPRAAITVTINPTSATPTVTSPVTYCQGATAVPLTATGTNLLWYTTAAGGVGSATAPTPSTATVGSTTWYVSQSAPCEGPRAAITVTINATPAAPTVTSPVTYCQGTVSAPLTATGTNLLWYTAAAGGVGSATAPTPSTATAGSTIYYVSQTTGTCEGPRAAITVTINATPTAPTVTSPVTYCQGATASPLIATGTNLLWYTTAAGGVGSATAPTPTTATTGSTIYYVSQTTGTCEGPRAAITVTINATPAAPAVTSPVTYCQGATAIPLTATGTNLLWYANAAGGVGSATAPTPSTATTGSTIYYVSQTTGTCEGPRAAITVTINATPAAPTVTSPVTYCQGATAIPLTATGTNLLWYANAAGGVGSATAPTPSSASTGSTIYYVSQTTGACEGPRAAITVTINATPAAPAVTTPVTYCQNAVAVPLTATGTNLLWYTVATGGAGSATAPTPLTATVGSTIYYVSQSNGACEGPRAAITVTIKNTPAAPLVSSPVTYCQNTIAAALTATGTNLLWYTTATGGVGSATAPTPSTIIPGSTTFYVSQSAPCEGPRAAITVTINAMPAAGIVAPVFYCQGVAAAPLTAGGTNLLWYTTPTGGVGSTTAPTPSTTTPGTTIYYVSQSNGACEGPRAALPVTINPTPSITPITDATLCEGSSLLITPVVTPDADTYSWRSITSGVPNSSISSLNTKETTVSPVNNVKYVLHASLASCAAEDTVQINVNWKPVAEAGPNKAICPGDSILLTGSISHFSGAGGQVTYSWTPTDSLTTPIAIQTYAHPSQSTWYHFNVITTAAVYGCDFSVYDSVKLVVQPKVHAFAGNDTIAVKNMPHQLYGTGGVSYTWSSPTAVFSNPYSQNPTTVLSNDANIYLKVKDPVGCEGFDSVFIKVYNGPTFYVPTAFTPNGDGLNDVFRVIPVGMAGSSWFSVYNRYGELMFETTQWLKGWDGTWHGKPAPEGAYVWMAKGTDTNNKVVEMKGTVILIR